ncbi:hypothetical protein [Actinomadura alba]|uniref:Uncharacterized protein n=1 Tax=Actinomadura alba TaxID=406431 RepID=A0ABR7LHI0_9ACTN|nr:hypothetical protein [Actinomadura alba]MBC6464243.1 hypothetical protein [Actinomadura alba]
MESRLRSGRADVTVVDVPDETRHRQPAVPGEHKPRQVEGMPPAPGAPMLCRTCSAATMHVLRCQGDPIRMQRTKGDILSTCQVCRRRVELVCEVCGTRHKPVRTYGAYYPED